MPRFVGGDLAVVIHRRESWARFGVVLDSLARQTATGFEVIVVDGAAERPSGVSGVRFATQERPGPGAARNAGARATDRPLLLFLSGGALPATDLIERHLAAHERHSDPHFGVVGRIAPHPRVEHNPMNAWFSRSIMRPPCHGYRADVPYTDFSSKNASLKREFFLSAEGFDEEFVHSYEDLDLAWRLHEKGLRLVSEPNAVVHLMHLLDWPELVQSVQRMALGERLMAKKHSSFVPQVAGEVRASLARRKLSRVWPRLAAILPSAISPIRRYAAHRADVWFYQQLGPYFLDSWEGAEDLWELREYLGDRYDMARLVDHAAQVRREFETVGDERAFYRSSEAYLYDLTAFAISGIKVPYLQTLRRHVPIPARVLDWGCGIGSDGLRLIGNGYEVAFADFDNPSTRYLRWRLERRGLRTMVYDIDRDHVPGGFDAAFAFDVIEHVEEPYAFLHELETRARVVIVNLLEDEADDPYPHRPLPIKEILDRAERRGIISYRLYHGRSHLVAYRGSASLERMRDRMQSYVQRRLGSATPALHREHARLQRALGR